MNICDYIINQPPSAIAGILTCCGYALREEITLFSAVEEMGFDDISIDHIDDVTNETQLAFLSVFCASQIVLKDSNPFTQEYSS